MAEAIELLRAIREAVVIPYPATVGDGEVHDRILLERIGHVRTALKSALDGTLISGWAWMTDYLRERLAEHPPVGYVTQERADAALAEGKTWPEAVTPPDAGDGGAA
jgi:hypothetical protein